MVTIFGVLLAWQFADKEVDNVSNENKLGSEMFINT